MASPRAPKSDAQLRTQRTGSTPTRQRPQTPHPHSLQQPQPQAPDKIPRTVDALRETISDPSSFSAHWYAGLWEHRFVLDDYTRVMVFPNNVAVSFEAAPSVVDARCTYCPVHHGPRAWDCQRPGIKKKRLPLQGETAYSPVTGIAEAGYEVLSDEPRAKFRRMGYHIVRVHQVKK
jgi:hypothetical protein